MKVVWASILLAFAAAPSASALAESIAQGVYDFLISIMLLRLKDTVTLIAENMAAKPDLSSWPIMIQVHDGFTWISGFFVMALTYQGLRYVMAADSPAGRAAAKLAVERLVAGMVLVSLNSQIYGLGLDFSFALTGAFVGSVAVEDNMSSRMLMLATASLSCIVAPVGLLILLYLLLMFLGRYLALVILYALFPLILAFYFSQLGPLTRLGGKGLNVYLAAVFSGPVMGLLFKVSYELLNSATAALESGDAFKVNGFEPLLAIMMSLAGFLMAGLSPLALFGLMDRFAAVASVAATAVGGIAGGAAAGAVAGGLVTSTASPLRDAAQGLPSQQPAVRQDLLEAAARADQALRRNAAKVAAAESHDGGSLSGRLGYMRSVFADSELLGLYGSLKEYGVIREDGGRRIQVGDGGLELARSEPGLLTGYGEWPGGYGRGFGDAKSRALAQSQGVLSDGRVVLRHAVERRVKSVDGQYDVAVNDGDNGLYNVLVVGSDKASFHTLPSSARQGGPEALLDEITDVVARRRCSPGKAVESLSGLQGGGS